MTHTYNAEQARRDYPKPWIHRGEAVDLCIRFGFSEYEWRRKEPRIPRHPDTEGWTRYDRDALIAILQG